METSILQPPERVYTPALVHGRPASLEEAVAAAAEILSGSRLPLVFGLVDATVAAQRSATELADLLGGVIDPATSATHASSVLAFQRAGHLTATLGEIRARADLVVYWGVDPDLHHPGFRARYLRPALGRKPARELAVDLGHAAGPEPVPERLAIAAQREYEALVVLRALVRGRRVEEEHASRLGAPLPRLRALARLLLDTPYTIILHDADPPPARRDPLVAEAFTALLRALSEHVHCRAIGVRLPGNPVGAEQVLTWQTGYPFAVSFTRGYPRFGPDEFTGEALLTARETDAVLLVGDLPPGTLSRPAWRSLRNTALLTLGTMDPDLIGHSAVAFATVAADEVPGAVYRMDGVALRRRGPALVGPTPELILSAIVARVRAAGAEATP